MQRKPGRSRPDADSPAPVERAPAAPGGRVPVGVAGEGLDDPRRRRSRPHGLDDEMAQRPAPAQRPERAQPKPQHDKRDRHLQDPRPANFNPPRQHQAPRPPENRKQPPHPHNNKKQHDPRNVRRVRPAGREDAEFQRREEPTKRRAETWWADRWLSVLQRFGWKGRLSNGRLYADEGRVVGFAIETGQIRARVQGSRTEPYDVTIGLKPLPDSDWELVTDIMSCQALFTAQLLAGEMPLDVEEAFDAAQAPLFPRHKEDIKAHCSCPDWANPCKHVAAVYYMMADAFDKDPFLIFHLRGRSREALIAMLRAQRAAEAQAMPMSVEALDAGSLEPFRFWQAGEELEAVHIAIAQPAVPGGTPKRLGRPPFWRSPADPVTRLGEVYEAIARRAREVALNEPLVGMSI